MTLTRAAIFGILLQSFPALSLDQSPAAEAGLTTDLNSIFQHSSSRHLEVTSQAIQFITSLQTKNPCTQMAASHLLNECKDLEHAPGQVKNRAGDELDRIRDEYAAKLAICELSSAQVPNNGNIPQNCRILIPSSQACSEARQCSWLWACPQPTTEKQCYPSFTESQLRQCIHALSNPVAWTSYSNARNNVINVCHATRDAIERENHLAIFKNLTQVMGGVSASMQHTTDEYTSLLHDQKRFAEELRETQSRFKKDTSAVQEKALATVSDLDDKFHIFMNASFTQLIAALANSQAAEIARIRETMQAFSRDMMIENSQLAQNLTTELQHHHDRAIISLELNHRAQVNSHEVLSGHMSKITVKAGSFLTIIDDIEHRLNNLLSKAEYIAKAFTFLSSLPRLVISFFQGLVATIGALFILSLLYRISKCLATYLAGACSAAYFLHICGVYDFLSESQRSSSLLTPFLNLSATHKGIGIVVLLWLATYPVSCVSTVISRAVSRVFSSYWIREYTNDGGSGYLLDVEIPRYTVARKVGTLEQGVAHLCR